jgi:hypothetical protein
MQSFFRHRIRPKGITATRKMKDMQNTTAAFLGLSISFADWNDPRQACILVDASYNDDSAFAAEIANHATITLHVS